MRAAALIRRFMLALALALGAFGCEESCDSVDINARTLHRMRAWYLYPDQLTEDSPHDYGHPPDYVRALVDNVDLLPDAPEDIPDRFSGMMSRERFQAMSEGVQTTFGLRVQVVATSQGERLFVADVLGQYPGEPPSPASRAGLRRGWQIQTIDGVNVPALLAADDQTAAAAQLRELLDQEEMTVGLFDASGNPADDQLLQRASVETHSLATARVFSVSEKTVGYLHLRNFRTRGAFEQLRATFADFAAAGTRHLVIDLRYNGGGSVGMLEYLGNLIAGRDAEGALFVRFAHNLERRSHDEELTLSVDPTCPEGVPCAGNGVSLSNVEQVVVLSTGATASASELVVDGLRPYVPVSVIGSRTLGKPVGGYVMADCDWVLIPIAFRIETALGPSAYFDGIAPTCEIQDDLTRDFGDDQEGMFAAALHWIETGTCPGAPAGPRLDEARRPVWDLSPGLRNGGWFTP